MTVLLKFVLNSYLSMYSNEKKRLIFLIWCTRLSSKFFVLTLFGRNFEAHTKLRIWNRVLTFSTIEHQFKLVDKLQVACRENFHVSEWWNLLDKLSLSSLFYIYIFAEGTNSLSALIQNLRKAGTELKVGPTIRITLSMVFWTSYEILEISFWSKNTSILKYLF